MITTVLAAAPTLYGLSTIMNVAGVDILIKI